MKVTSHKVNGLIKILQAQCVAFVSGGVIVPLLKLFSDEELKDDTRIFMYAFVFISLFLFIVIACVCWILEGKAETLERQEQESQHLAITSKHRRYHIEVPKGKLEIEIKE